MFLMRWCLLLLLSLELLQTTLLKIVSAQAASGSWPDDDSPWRIYQTDQPGKQDVNRWFLVYVPETLTGASSNKQAANGIIYLFHGLSMTVSLACLGDASKPSLGDSMNWYPKNVAHTHGFVVVCVFGYEGSQEQNTPVDSRGSQGWNNEIQGGSPKFAGIDDVAFFEKMVALLEDLLAKDFGVDYPSKNRFAMGHSTGGLFIYRLACDLARLQKNENNQLLDGISALGSTYDWYFDDVISGPAHWVSNCPSTLVNVRLFNLIGDLDRFTTSTKALEKWGDFSVNKLGCEPANEQTNNPNSDVTCYEYTQCRDDNVVSKACVADGLRHVVKKFGDTPWNIPHIETAWNFMKTLPLTGVCLDETNGGSIARPRANGWGYQDGICPFPMQHGSTCPITCGSEYIANATKCENGVVAHSECTKPKAAGRSASTSTTGVAVGSATTVTTGVAVGSATIGTTETGGGSATTGHGMEAQAEKTSSATLPVSDAASDHEGSTTPATAASKASSADVTSDCYHGFSPLSTTLFVVLAVGIHAAANVGSGRSRVSFGGGESS
eukprot:TRINITY_DN10310_c0_g1_i1.p1 TRINITY_DN10310_c0_g1~~TRINITY_DN10310_c0_g1_i1.p1  ORF type:complete len:553 (-),score=53.78 TRINITY_DN10310_c0_g1_i1:204-1862(-)